LNLDAMSAGVSKEIPLPGVLRSSNPIIPFLRVQPAWEILSRQR